MSDKSEVQATITGSKSDVQPAVFGVWLTTIREGFEDTKKVTIYADNEEDAAVDAILNECYGYDADDDDNNDVDLDDVRKAVRGKYEYTDPASITDISVDFVIPLTVFNMKMVVDGNESTFRSHYPIGVTDLPEYVINHYF